MYTTVRPLPSASSATCLPSVAGRLSAGMARPGRWLAAPSSTGTGRPSGSRSRSGASMAFSLPASPAMMPPRPASPRWSRLGQTALGHGRRLRPRSVPGWTRDGHHDQGRDRRRHRGHRQDRARDRPGRGVVGLGSRLRQAPARARPPGGRRVPRGGGRVRRHPPDRRRPRGHHHALRPVRRPGLPRARPRPGHAGGAVARRHPADDVQQPACPCAAAVRAVRPRRLVAAAVPER